MKDPRIALTTELESISNYVTPNSPAYSDYNVWMFVHGNSGKPYFLTMFGLPYDELITFLKTLAHLKDLAKVDPEADVVTTLQEVLAELFKTLTGEFILPFDLELSGTCLIEKRVVTPEFPLAYKTLVAYQRREMELFYRNLCEKRTWEKIEKPIRDLLLLARPSKGFCESWVPPDLEFLLEEYASSKDSETENALRILRATLGNDSFTILMNALLPFFLHQQEEIERIIALVYKDFEDAAEEFSRLFGDK